MLLNRNSISTTSFKVVRTSPTPLPDFYRRRVRFPLEISLQSLFQRASSPSLFDLPLPQNPRRRRPSEMGIDDQILKEVRGVKDELVQIHDGLVQRNLLMKRNLNMTRFGFSLCAVSCAAVVYLYTIAPDSGVTSACAGAPDCAAP
ncbi:unnamed protein product [Cuscuta campestris]|uniref:Uncharacterized protein n=1 Tax=Cuscuta campestris TaxID=132261 RepID=A0A484LA63_9ASTE|nr:unnamed protein product [Cuscuta campestris]